MGRIKSNPFIYASLLLCLNYLFAHDPNFKCSTSEATILAERPYYSASQIAHTTPSHFASYGNTKIADVKKTGLGSSAALVSSLVGAILTFYGQPDPTRTCSPAFLDTVHNLAQLAHIVAQGKIGSGFDVAAAVFGSCVYRTYEKDVLAPISDLENLNPQLVRELVDGKSGHQQINCEIQKLGHGIPAGLRLVICDVEGGSQTVGMVRSMNTWRKARPTEARELWSKLDEQNTRLIHLMGKNSMPNASQDSSHSASISSVEAVELSHTITAIRTLLRAMGESAGIPIEPPLQTRLLDACCELDGVLGGVVPGAGGFDALVFILRDNIDVMSALKSVLLKLSKDGVVQQQISVLEVDGSYEGLRLESPDRAEYMRWFLDE